MHGARILAAQREFKLMDSVASGNGQLIPPVLPQRRKKALGLYLVQERILNPCSFLLLGA